MVYLRALARAAAQIFLFWLGLWGLQVTPDLTTLIGVGAAIGLINFAIAIYDGRQLAAAAVEAAEDRQTLRELQKHVMKLVAPADIPPHLQDTSRLSNTELKGLVGSMTERLRAFAAETGEGVYPEPWWHGLDAEYNSMSEEEKGRRHMAWGDALTRRLQVKAERFQREIRPDALALWEELTKRVRIDRGPNPALNTTAIEDGLLAGARPIEACATALEAAARQLPS